LSGLEVGDDDHEAAQSYPDADEVGDEALDFVSSETKEGPVITAIIVWVWQRQITH
jgi:hypothetical protein